MAQQQINGVGSRSFPCPVCKQPFTDPSNRRRHMKNQHPGVQVAAVEDVRRVEEVQDCGGLQLRHFVEAAVGEILESNFTQSATSLTAQVRALLPGFTDREAQILVASAGAATRHMAFLQHTLEVLRRAGDQSSAAERDLARRLAYLAIGPRWPNAAGESPHLDQSSRPASPFVAAAEIGTVTVRRWLSAADTLRAAQPAERPEPPSIAANLELMELDMQGSAPPPPVPTTVDERPAYASAQPSRSSDRGDGRGTTRRSGSHGRCRERSRENDRHHR